jgi:Calcineurin-like phosphoesterase
MQLRRLSLLLAVLLIVAFESRPEARAGAPGDYIRVPIERLYGLLGQPGLGRRGANWRAARETLVEVFDWGEMGNRSLGRRFDGWTAVERVEPKLHALVQKGPGVPPEEGVVLAGAGDIASCVGDGDEATARLLDAIGGVVFTLGDHAYEAGTPIEFEACYDPSWGRHKARTRPTPGNHDYLTPRAFGYFDYFGAAAGERDKGYYSYHLGAWRIIVLNSNCSDAGGCDTDSAQVKWLRANLASSRTMCTLAYWHHPRFSSGPNGSEPEVQAFWQALHDHRAEVVLSGHDHVYERFAPQDAEGRLDLTRGLRQFVVGTGGGSHHRFPGPAIANSEIRNDDTFGVLKLTLYPTRYEWQFIPVAGKTFTDSGTAPCR